MRHAAVDDVHRGTPLLAASIAPAVFGSMPLLMAPPPIGSSMSRALSSVCSGPCSPSTRWMLVGSISVSEYSTAASPRSEIDHALSLAVVRATAQVFRRQARWLA